MRETDFTGASPGHLVPAATLDGNYWPAFVPDPLPPSIDWNETLAAALVACRPGIEPTGWQGFGFTITIPADWTYDGAGSGGVKPHRGIGHPLSRRFTNFSSLERRRTGMTPRRWITTSRRCSNGLNRLSALPISLRLLCEIHRELMSGVRGSDRRPGEFRTRQVIIGSNLPGIENARYVPPSAR